MTNMAIKLKDGQQKSTSKSTWNYKNKGAGNTRVKIIKMDKYDQNESVAFAIEYLSREMIYLNHLLKLSTMNICLN